ncbi:hypothetical protein E3Q23_01147 [Wallemia mellicola]|uniref:TfdA family taurine dioxygenase n=1 Tax=Wallemia mellicola TaxID=1708541 RepID=A0AB38N028_9BASI|nr:hypothetical protein E3Q24_01351 [Wallemia mellicola]TIB77762.1 hypothetical protein E3Q23_01147 [Wallemia mellicola]TIC06052.1 putative TfdA family taurine dioxygenase [Wallemia mellicola]TIC23026.1 putative TfdA family taurine dioxygenase [Wallemia mellicola]TIC44782.1 putative TfdA family taurine dioxygenase [Wallemia mellicola]
MSQITETLTTLTLNGTDLRGPFEYPASWDNQIDRHLTPAIGTQIKSGVQLSDILNNDKLVHELAVLISRRGVVVFKDQNLNEEQQAKLGQALGELTGKPKDSKLHIHPLTPDFGEFGQAPAVFNLDDKFNQDNYDEEVEKSEHAAENWHTDITFENVPSDYAILKMHTVPAGGDTLWSSAYTIYDKISPALRTFLSTLTATHHAPTFQDAKRKYGITFRGEKPEDVGRGSDENRGAKLQASHPIIRTNPVTGWHGVFVNKCFTKKIDGLKKDESDALLNYLYHLQNSHDAQVRYQWTKNDVALWDNRTTTHCCTLDTTGPRAGNRVLGIGERPYYDTKGSSRAENLKSKGLAF